MVTEKETRTFADDIERAAEEPIEAVVIGVGGWGSWNSEDGGYGMDARHAPGLARKGEVLSWEQARPLLDYEYDTGHGAPDCHAITAWSANKVLWVTQYDGATWVDSVPRNPIEHHPTMPGG